MFRPATLFLILFVLLVALFIAAAMHVRFAPSDPDAWHVDPTQAPDPTRPNFARVDREVDVPPEEVATRIAEVARREGAELLAGDEMFGTWIARTALMRFPDYVSIRLLPTETGTRIVAFSRARFGYSDRGVNRARLGRWIPE